MARLNAESAADRTKRWTSRATTTPLDDNGHGSHTASTAVGNVLPTAEIAAPTTSLTRKISGVAPHANLITYKACVVIGNCIGSSVVVVVSEKPKGAGSGSGRVVLVALPAHAANDVAAAALVQTVTLTFH